MNRVLVYGLKNGVGGIEKYLMTMHKHLCNKIEFVFLVEESDGFIYENEILENGGIIETLPERHSLGKYRKQFRKILRKYRTSTDLLYVNVGHISFDIIPIKIGLSEKYRVLTHSHSAMQEPIASLFYKLRQGILRTVGKWRLSHFDVERLAVSHRAGDYLFSGKPYEIVSPGIDVKIFVPQNDIRETIREKFDLGSAVVFGFVGRLVAVKNPLFLVEVLQAAVEMGRNAKLLVVGDGALLGEMKKRVDDAGLRERVVFSGEVNDVQDYYQAMDVLLAPSLSEGMPLGIMEAQSVGVPCVCAEGNFPKTIDVTGMVSFCRLEDGKEKWASVALEKAANSLERIEMNSIVSKSDLSIENASLKLLSVFER